MRLANASCWIVVTNWAPKLRPPAHNVLRFIRIELCAWSLLRRG